MKQEMRKIALSRHTFLDNDQSGLKGKFKPYINKILTSKGLQFSDYEQDIRI